MSDLLGPKELREKRLAARCCILAIVVLAGFAVFMALTEGKMFKKAPAPAETYHGSRK